MVTLYLPAGEAFSTYYKFGPTPNDGTDHWYEFLDDGQTGADIDGDVITLHFVDGLKGDDDLTADGTVIDIGGPGVSFTPLHPDDGGGGGGGGGGCLITTAAYGFREAEIILAIILLLVPGLNGLAVLRRKFKPNKRKC